MKKILTFIFLIAISTVTMAQTFPTHPPVQKQTTQANKNGDVFVCPDGSLFSKISQSPQTGFFCQQGDAIFLAADSYTASAPFSRFRFWGGDFTGCSLTPSESFDIFIWDGNPSAGGNLIFSQTLNGNTTNTGYIVYYTDIYQIDIDLGTTINQLSGWIGITRKNPTCNWAFGWATYDFSVGGDSYSYDGAHSSWLATYSKLMFCLSGTPPPPVPLSNWALYLGIFLIVIFTAIRFRRMI